MHETLATGEGQATSPDQATQPDIVTTPEESVLNTLMSIGRRIRQRVSGDVLDPGTFHILHSLRCMGATRVTDLATALRLDTSTVSRHLQQLDRGGLIERSQHPDDGRAQQVALTEEGMRMLDRGIARRRELLSGVLRSWERNDVVTLDRLLSRLIAEIDTGPLDSEDA